MIRGNLLIHSITYYQWLGNSGQDGEQYDTPIIINKVRVEPISKIVGATGGKEYTSKTRIFYDLKLSTSATIRPKSKIEFTNTQGEIETYYIQEIQEMYSRGQHHLEIWCS